MENSRQKNRPRRQKRQKKVSPIPRFPYQPECYKVSLISRDYDTGTGVASPTWRRYGVLEPLSFIPQYMAVLFQIYRRARIVSSSVTVKLINMGSEPIELLTGTMPFNWIAGSPTVAELIGKYGTKRAIASVSGGMDRVSLSKHVTSEKLLGHEYMLADYDFGFSQAAVNTPIDQEEPVWIIATTAVNSSTTTSYRLEIVLNYEVEFFDLYTA